MKPNWKEKEEKIEAKKKYQDVVIPDGEYRGTVVHSKWITSQYSISQYNPKGTCLSVWVDIKQKNNQTKRLFDKISVTNPTRLNELRSACGLNPIGKNDDFNEDDVLNEHVIVKVIKYTSKVGKISNIIKEYVIKDYEEDYSDNDNDTTEEDEMNDDSSVFEGGNNEVPF